MNLALETKMNSIPRMSRLIVAAIFMAGSPGSLYAASALASASAQSGGSRTLPFGGKTANTAAQARAGADFAGLPMYFEKNHGQTDASVKFFTRSAGYNLYLTGSEAVMVMAPAKAAKTPESVVVRMKLKGANPKPTITGLDIMPGRTSYYIGSNPAKWQVGVEQYARVKFGSVYPGIDMVYYGKQGGVEHDFIVAPGANVGRILVGFEGAKSLRLDLSGNLILGVAGGELSYKAPKLYQMRGERKVSVNGRYVLAGKNQVRIEVGDYIRSKELVIDPALVYSTYLGGTNEDKVTAIAVDGTQQAYVTGYSISDADGVSGFPTATNPLGTPKANNGKRHVFVAKLSPNGATLMWLVWMAGTLDEQANSIVLDKSNAATPKVFIAGTTASQNFPMVAQLQTCASGTTGTLAFAAEIQQPANIPAMVYSTCWGGVSALNTSGNAIAVDSVGAAYVTGTTFATNFPTSLGTPAPFNTMGSASEDAFLFKVAPGGASMAYSMFLGPTDVITNGNAVAVDATFNAWVAGMTTSSTLPDVVGHFSSSKVGTSDAFVVKVNPSGTGLLYATYFNGNSDQAATAIALDNAGAVPYNVFLAGWTVSATGFPSTAYYNLPTTVRPVVYQKDLVGADDPFIIRLDPAAANPVPGSDNPLEVVYATHLGATGADRAYALALDSRDDAYIAGWTLSSDWTLAADPVTPGAGGINVTGAVTQNTSGGQDAFVAAIGPTGQYQPFFTYLGATPPGQAATGIAIDALHNIYVGGYTPSAIFPLVTGSLEDSSVGGVGGNSVNRTGTAGAFDGFVTKIAPVTSFGAPVAGPPPVIPPVVPGTCNITSVNPNSGFTIGGTTVTIIGTGFAGFGGPGAVKFDGVAASTYTANASSTVITAVSPRHPLTGTLASGAVALTVTTSSGTCTGSYAYIVTPSAAPGTCGEDFFFPSPATTAVGTFAYCMEQSGTARIRVYNVIGDLAAKLEDSRASGPQTSSLNTQRLAPGVYLYFLEKDYGNGNVIHSGVKKFVVKH
ncbi:MAG: SBBP repeat-containing protein [Elusimicrobiota bacterium]